MHEMEKKIITDAYIKIVKLREFPNTGRPVCRCVDCDFYGVVCLQKNDVVGCYGGWSFKEK